MADCRGARARGVRGNLSGQTRRPPYGRSPQQCDAPATHCPYPGMCGNKARRCGPTGTAPAPPEARRYSDEIAGRCQSRRGDSVSAGSEVAPGRAAAGRWSEGVLTKPKPQAARYPAGCPPLSAAKCGEAEEACPNVWRGNGGGNSPRANSHSGEGRAKRERTGRQRRYPAPLPVGRPSPPAILRAWLDAGTPAAILRRWLQPGG